MNVLVWTVAGIVIILALLLVILYGLLRREVHQAGLGDVLHFAQENAASGRTALSIRFNGEFLADVNASVRMSLGKYGEDHRSE